MIRFTCPRCGKSLKAAPGAAGAPGRCTRCHQPLSVPVPAPVPVLDVSMLAAPPQAQPIVQPPPTTRRRGNRLVRALWGLVLSGATSAVALVVGALLVYFLLPKDSPLRFALDSVPGALQQQSQPPVFRVPEKRSEPKIDAEELVKAYVVNNALKNRAEFHRWGPHMSGAELRELYREAVVVGSPTAEQEKEMRELEGVTLVRVCYRELVAPRWLLDDRPAEMTEQDRVFFVEGKKVDGRNINFTKFQTGQDQSFVVNVASATHIFQVAKAGDDWKNRFRRVLAARYPAIKLN